jgi:hypothetical protein
VFLQLSLPPSSRVQTHAPPPGLGHPYIMPTFNSSPGSIVNHPLERTTSKPVFERPRYPKYVSPTKPTIPRLIQATTDAPVSFERGVSALKDSTMPAPLVDSPSSTSNVGDGTGSRSQPTSHVARQEPKRSSWFFSDNVGSSQTEGSKIVRKPAQILSPLAFSTVSQTAATSKPPTAEALHEDVCKGSLLTPVIDPFIAAPSLAASSASNAKRALSQETMLIPATRFPGKCRKRKLADTPGSCRLAVGSQTSPSKSPSRITALAPVTPEKSPTLAQSTTGDVNRPYQPGTHFSEYIRPEGLPLHDFGKIKGARPNFWLHARDGGGGIAVHKDNLTAHSNVIRLKLSKDRRKRRLDVTETRVIILALVPYFYPEIPSSELAHYKCHQDCNLLPDLYVAAAKYGLLINRESMQLKIAVQ